MSTTPRKDNVRLTGEALAAAQAARRRTHMEREHPGDVADLPWIVGAGLLVVALVVVIGMVWWGW